MTLADTSKVDSETACVGAGALICPSSRSDAAPEFNSNEWEAKSCSAGTAATAADPDPVGGAVRDQLSGASKGKSSDG